MMPGFSVRVTATFEREFRKLLKGHPDLTAHFERVIAVLAHDPYNRTRSHPIKRLTGVIGSFMTSKNRLSFSNTAACVAKTRTSNPKGMRSVPILRRRTS